MPSHTHDSKEVKCCQLNILLAHRPTIDDVVHGHLQVDVSLSLSSNHSQLGVAYKPCLRSMVDVEDDVVLELSVCIHTLEDAGRCVCHKHVLC